jgi:hypothetical protein
LKQEAPALQRNGLEYVWNSVSDVYDNEQIKITRVFPNWVNPGEVFEVILNVVKKQGAENVKTVELTEKLEHFTHIEGLDAQNKIRIINEDFGDASEINYAYTLTADKEYHSGSISG